MSFVANHLIKHLLLLVIVVNHSLRMMIHSQLLTTGCSLAAYVEGFAALATQPPKRPAAVAAVAAPARRYRQPSDELITVGRGLKGGGLVTVTGKTGIHNQLTVAYNCNQFPINGSD